MKACQGNSATNTRPFFFFFLLPPLSSLLNWPQEEAGWHQLQSAILPISWKMFFTNIWELVRVCKLLFSAYKDKQDFLMSPCKCQDDTN